MALGSVELSLYVYTGTVGNYSSGNLVYTVTKDRIANRSNIVLEIGELVRDYIEISFNNDYLSNAVWVTAVVNYFDETGNAFNYGNPATFNYIALEGYGYFEDGINPELSRHALITSDNIYIPEGTAGKFPIFAEGVGKVTIDSTDTQITDNGNSNQKVQYITIPADSSSIKVYDTDDATLLKTVTITNVCEPKYSNYKVTFLNKYGAFEDLYFFKKTTESFDVTSEEYKTNIIDSGTLTYDTYKTQRQLYNVNARTKISLNTGFIKEDMNSTIEELMVSENVWIRWEGKTLPINPLTKNFLFKTSLNDKLINYTIDFEFGFNKINNIR
tara:strand:+ start:136 stop:1122 length:987 start_codon:yes stop_codon:yes gene_type:complete